MPDELPVEPPISPNYQPTLVAGRLWQPGCWSGNHVCHLCDKEIKDREGMISNGTAIYPARYICYPCWDKFTRFNKIVDETVRLTKPWN